MYISLFSPKLLSLIFSSFILLLTPLTDHFAFLDTPTAHYMTQSDSETDIPVMPVSKKSPAPSLEETLKAEEGGMGRFFGEFMNMLFALGLIIGLMLVVAWVMKRLLNTRLQQMNTTSLIKILERRTISPKGAVYLIEAGGKGFLVAESASGFERLGEVPLNYTEEAETPTDASTSFGEIMKRKLKNE